MGSGKEAAIETRRIRYLEKEGKVPYIDWPLEVIKEPLVGERS